MHREPRYTEYPVGVFTPANTVVPRFIMHNGVLFFRKAYANNFTYGSYLDHARELMANADKVIKMRSNQFVELWKQTKDAENIPEAFAVAVAMALIEGRLEEPE